MIQVDPVRSDPTYPVRVSPLHADVDLTPKIILIIKIIVNVVNIENALCKCILILIISTRTRKKEKIQTYKTWFVVQVNHLTSRHP